MEPKTDAQLVAMSVFDIFVRQLDEPTRIAVMYDCEDRYIAHRVAFGAGREEGSPKLRPPDAFK